MQKVLRADLLKTVYGVETTKEILEVFRADYKEIKDIEGTNRESLQRAINIFQRYLLAITYLYKISSINNNLQAFRKVIKEEKGEIEDYVLKAFHLGGGKDSKIQSIHKLLSSKVTEKVEQREQKESKSDLEIVAEIKRVKSLLDTNSYTVKSNQQPQQVRSYYLAYILGGSGGRRFGEVLKTSKIRKKGSSYIYTGILKKDGSSKTEIEVNLIGLTIEEYKAYQRELRSFIDSKLLTTKGKSLKDTSIGEINNIFSKVYNNAVKRISNSKVPNFHELRHHYTIKGTEMFKREGESERETRYRILGHELKEDTTRTYATIK